MLRHLFNYTSVALVVSQDSYGTDGADAFRAAAAQMALDIVASETFAPCTNVSACSFQDAYVRLRASRAQIIAILAGTQDAARFMVGATRSGLVGGEGFLWFGSSNLTLDELWLEDADLAFDMELRRRVLKGFFGIRPHVD